MGFDWPGPEPVFAKVLEEVVELREATAASAAAREPAAAARDQAAIAEEIGDLLFACVNLARHVGVDPEAALRAANAKFTARFHRIEAALAEAGRNAADVGLPELDRLWEDAKQAERGRTAPGAVKADPKRRE